MRTPLEQFLIKPIFRIYNNWIDLTITNSTIYLIISIFLILIIFNITFQNTKLIKARWGLVLEQSYLKIEEITKEMIPGVYKKYIPFIIAIFFFILTNNVIGLIPYSFTTTAHFIVTITMSLTIMIGVTIIGIVKHKHKFIFLFIPNGLNQGLIKLIIPFIFCIEILSYLIRVISLSVRLAANLISGHTLLKIIANFGLKYTISLPILMVIPVILLSAIYLLEIGVAIIQAYVFTLLTSTYIRDTELLH
jgi:ATP synthase subunit 6